MAITQSGTSITFNDATSQTTAGYPNSNPSGFTSNTGTVTSVATGNGLSGGTITSSGTLTVACPSVGSVGSYAFLLYNSAISPGSNYSSLNYGGLATSSCYGAAGINGAGSVSGTWKAMGGCGSGNPTATVFCRVS